MLLLWGWPLFSNSVLTAVVVVMGSSRAVAARRTPWPTKPLLVVMMVVVMIGSSRAVAVCMTSLACQAG